MEIGISILIVVITTCLYKILSIQRRRPNEPPLSFGLPYIGQGFAFMSNFGELVARLRNKYGSIVTVVIFGQRMHFVTDHDFIRNLWKMPDIFSFDEIAFDFEVKLSGKESHKKMPPGTEPLRSDLLRGTQNVNDLAIRFRGALKDTINNNLEFRQKEFKKFDLREFTSSLVFAAAGRSLFGKTWLNGVDIHEASNKFNVFESQLSLIAAGLPKIFIRKGLEARDYLVREALLPQVKRDFEGSHPFISIMEGHVKSLYEPGEETDLKLAARLMGILFAINSNTINSLFWALSRIYLADEQLRIDLRKEIEMAKPSTSSSYLDSKRNMPLMNSVILETFRLHSFPSSMRSVLKDCTIKDVRSGGSEVSFREGDAVFLLGFYDQFKGEHDSTFDGRRWMKYTTNPELNQKLFAVPHDEGLILFGGGKHLCPGRFFALIEMHLMISFCFEHYDIKLEKDSILPPTIQNALPINQPTVKFPIQIRYNGA